MKRITTNFFLIILLASICQQLHAQERQLENAVVNVDFSKENGDMKPIWAWFGYDEPNYTYMKDGKKLLSEIAELSPVPVFVRTHYLLNTGDGKPDLKWGSTNIYTEDANGNPVYNWTIVDSIFDTYIQRGMKPLAQLSFMPEALSSKPQPYKVPWKPGEQFGKTASGWAFPPKDYTKWSNLCYQWAKHCVERYGRKEVESWYWEVWNEPNGGRSYWNGNLFEYFKLYDYAVAGVKRALPTAKIGGCDVNPNGVPFLAAFLKHCVKDTNYATGKVGSPLDVILFHAKGKPKLVGGKVQMGISNQLYCISKFFATIKSFPQLNNIPVIIGESDPEGCAACNTASNPEDAYRNGTMYPSYNADAFARTYALAAKNNINLIGAVTWAFEFEGQPWFAGFRDLATNGIDKPILNLYRMFGKMGGKLLEANCNRMYDLKTIQDSGVKKGSDIGVLASKNGNKAAVMIWNYHDNDSAGRTEPVSLLVNKIPAKAVMVTHYRIDDAHSNAYQIWKKMGSPQNPTDEQLVALKQSDGLQAIQMKHKIKIKDETLELNFDLPKQGVSLIAIEYLPTKKLEK